MEKIVRLFIPLIYLLSFIFTPRTKSRVSHFFQLVYYYWIRRHFKYIGKVTFLLPTYLDGIQYISIGDGSRIGKRAMLAVHKVSVVTEHPEICIGEKCVIGDDCNLQSCNSIRIGNGVLLGRKVMINDTSHGRFVRGQLDMQPNSRPLCSKGPIVIEDNVWIGEMVCVLGNVHIGKGSIIGAGSVVTKDIPEYSLAVGSPARVIKSLNTEYSD